jgi:drug/metabolite transporter (DMT)-like permease
MGRMIGPAGMSEEAAGRRSLLEIHLAVFLFGFPGLFGKWLALPPSVIVLGRVAFAAVFLAALLGAAGLPFRVRPGRDSAVLALCGLILAVHWTMFFTSVQVSSVAVGLLSYSSFPVFTAILEPLAFRERFDRKSLFFALLCVIGVFLIVPRLSLADSVVRGVLWGLGAGLTFSVLTLLNRGLAKRSPSLTIAFYECAWAAGFLVPAAVIARPVITWRGIGLLAVLGIFCTAIAHSLFIKGMVRTKAATAAVISSLEPVYGIVLAYGLLGEVPALRTAAGGIVILAAALSVTAGARRSP